MVQIAMSNSSHIHAHFQNIVYRSDSVTQEGVWIKTKKIVNGLCTPTSPLPISSWVHPSLASEGRIDRKNVETAHLHMI